MPTTNDYVTAVENGAETSVDIAEELGVSEGHAQKKLKELAEQGELERHRDGNVYHYTAPDAAKQNGDAESVDADGEDGLMPVHRPYVPDDADYITRPGETGGFDELKPEDVGEYFATDGELEDAIGFIETVDVHGRPPRILVSGPTGCGKTTYADTLAAYFDAAKFTVQMSHDVSAKQLLGTPTLAGEDTVFVDGPVTRALMASNHGKVVLHLDEYNRAPAHAKNALFAALDYRGEVRLDGGRGGEVVQANPENIIFVATINEGDEYHGTERMDHAEANRWTHKFAVDYLATSSDDHEGVETEAELIVKETPAPAPLARKMSKAAADIRAEAADVTNTTVNVAPSTRQMLNWAAQAYANDHMGKDNPIVEAAKSTILRTNYGQPGDEDAFDEALSIVESHLDNAPFAEDEFEAFEADEVVRCDACSWQVPKPKAEDMGVLALGECPECGETDDLRTIRK